jgi:hypothetical protein
VRGSNAGLEPARRKRAAPVRSRRRAGKCGQFIIMIEISGDTG